MTLEQAFTTFNTNLQFNAGVQKQVAERRGRLIDRLQKAWHPAKVLPIGSWTRGTAIPPLKDVDLMVVLTGVSPEQRAPDALLGEFEVRLKPHYAEIPTRKQSRSIGLRFEGDFSFDVVPAIAKPAGGYYVPDVTDPRRWIFTNPEKHAELAAETNRQTGGWATSIVRMLKSWNANSKAGLKSFHIEVMALRAMKSAPRSHAEGVQLAFESLARDVLGACGDPGGSDNPIDTYLPASRGPLAQKLSEAARQMKEANRTQSQAIARSVFGSPFP